MPPTTSSPSTPNQSKESKQQKLVGSIPGGTPLLGLAYLKAKPLVLAKEDDEYPDWLWTLLAPESGSTSKELPRAAREKSSKKQQKLAKDLPQKVPLHEQSKDLTKPGDSAEISLQRRQELDRSSRAARRKAIKEENFLRGM